MTKILTPQQLPAVLEIARALLPPGMELVVVDPTKPEFYDVAADVDGAEEGDAAGAAHIRSSAVGP